MHFSTLVSAFFVAAASAQNTYPPINLGTYGFPHGNIFVAWSPFTPTTTQEVVDVCDAKGAIQGTATWSAIRTASTYVLKPICRNPFNITDDATNTTYFNLELACVDDNIDIGLQPQVTAVVDTATNKTIETCVPAPIATTTGCHGTTFESFSWQFACSA
ncbi:hypothetical protein EsH8_X_000594 [Colletotrichum jinshuiense]